jgi:hypothetical protein
MSVRLAQVSFVSERAFPAPLPNRSGKQD